MACPWAAPSAARAEAPCSCLCAVLDARAQLGSAGRPDLRTALFRLWTRAQREVLALQPQALPELSIITLHDGYYESQLPLGRHAAGAVLAALGRLEDEWVLQPLGLAPLAPPGEDGGLRELAARAGAGHAAERPHAGAGPRRPRHGGIAVRRLFAVGEDSALAALRSAMAQLERHAAAATQRSGAAVRRHVLEFWTPAPERLSPFAADLCRAARRGVEASILAVDGSPTDLTRPGPPDSAGGVAQQRASSARLLESELCRRAAELHVPLADMISVEALPLTVAAFARQVRGALVAGTSFQLLVRLPGPAMLGEMQLMAAPAGLWPTGMAKGCSGIAATVLRRLPASGVSCELLYGLPLLAHAPCGGEGSACASAPAEAAAAAALRALCAELRARREVLLLIAPLEPQSLAPAKSQYFFVGSPVAEDEQRRVPPMLALRGVVAADLWQPEASLCVGATGEVNQEQEEEMVREGASMLEEVPCWERFDPFQLRHGEGQLLHGHGLNGMLGCMGNGGG